METIYQYPYATDTASCEARTFSCDRFYVTVNTVTKIWKELGHLMYGTIHGDRGPQHCGIVSPSLQNGEFVWLQADLPIPLIIYRWNDSDKLGSWFISPYHGNYSATVIRRCRGEETSEKNFPLVAKDYNEDMGACDQFNSLRASYTTYLTHQRHWYMGLIYYGKDILDINS